MWVVFPKFLDRQLQQNAEKQEPTTGAPTTTDASAETAPSLRSFRLATGQNKAPVTIEHKNQPPQKDNSKKGRVWGYILFFIIVGLIGRLLGHSPSDSRTPPVTPHISSPPIATASKTETKSLDVQEATKTNEETTNSKDPERIRKLSN